MEFPAEIERLIVEQTWAWREPLRSDWRSGSPILHILHDDIWWMDYIYDYAMGLGTTSETTWTDWCQNKLIIGPPRMRSDRELTGFDEDYMNEEDIERHYIPWIHTWPASDDYSWCKVREVPEWAKEEFMRTRRK